MPIKILPENLVNQIAAGEVVERPASVVKELVENSLDAGAKNIIVEIEEGGRKLIKVIDDGQGMSAEDCKLALERHATSKISSLNDLFHISSFGFRGEALPSIASISRFSLKSRATKSAAGYEIRIEGGTLKNEGETGMPQGTQIEVRDLFWNVPARKKHLKTENTEFTQIAKIFTEIAMVNEQIGFKLIKNGKEYLNLNKDHSKKARFEALTNLPILKMSEILLEGLDYKISGLISKPELNFQNKSKQYIFVNKRPIVNFLINHTVREAYGSLLPKELHPAFILQIDLDPMLVDVNVHPRKTEVRFVNQPELLNKIFQAVSKTLGSADQTPSFSFGKKRFSYTSPQIRIGAKPSAEGISPPSPKLDLKYEQAQQMRSPYKALGQAHQAYILAESADGLVVIDQHAAHERILYEKLKKSRKENKQSLLIPELIELSATEDSLLQEYCETFAELGFEIEDLGGKTYKISSIPSSLSSENLGEVVRNVLSDLAHSGKSKSSTKHLDKVLTYLACRTAIKFNDSLSLLEQQELLNQLEELESGYTCPHGRPLKFEISREELDREFGRL